jgi:hypothetical protein
LPACAGLLIAITAGFHVSREATMNGKFAALPVDDASSMVSLRLVHGQAAKLLLLRAPPGGRRVFLTAAVGGGGTPEVLTSVSPVGPGWDASGAADGAVTFVMSNPESARVWLSSRSTAGGPTMEVSRHYSSAYFRGPRFVKGPQNNLAILSLATMEDHSGPVVFSREADGAYGQFRALPVPNGGELLDARLVRAADTYWFFTRFKAGKDGDRYTGIVYCSELNREFHEVRPAARCLDGRDVVDFDVDAGSGRVVLFAATRKGYVLTEAPEFGATEETAAGPLSSTSILIDGAAIHLAAIEAAGSAHAKVLIGRVGDGR